MFYKVIEETIIVQIFLEVMKLNSKVMTFNLRLNVESDGVNAWPFRYPAAAQAILQNEADIVCTQEGQHGMLLDLEQHLTEYAWIGEGRQGGHKDEFCAIFYKKEKYQVEEYGHFSLSETPDQLGVSSWDTACPRMCTWARFKSETESQFLVFNTHLDHISEEAQIEGMNLIKSKISQMRGKNPLPVIITGDFNVGPGHAVVRELEQSGYKDAFSALPGGVKEAGLTFHDFQGGITGEPIDYIFTTSDVTVNKIEVDRKEYDNRLPSDHYPVCAVLSS